MADCYEIEDFSNWASTSLQRLDSSPSFLLELLFAFPVAAAPRVPKNPALSTAATWVLYSSLLCSGLLGLLQTATFNVVATISSAEGLADFSVLVDQLQDVKDSISASTDCTFYSGTSDKDTASGDEDLCFSVLVCLA
ncbi:hypothetical protein AXF42_Ash013202 [Apostasia shenzhenica]|uniref:Uncharacterized protein n=1 Tax=Apostasia shenzhenica TaxID=1088818 RepID=A0A2I0BBD0_9ASPA|nr:hypothetical protein AXF42_Ash013202 [Apostasia shenzhenica]